MADPTTDSLQQFADSTNQAADASKAFGDAQTYAQNQLASVSTVLNSTSNVIDSLTDSYKTAAKSISTTGLFQDKDSRNIGLVTTALLGARDALGQFGSLNIQPSAFLAPISQMEDALKQGGGVLNATAEKVMSVFGSIIPQSATKSAAAIVQFGKNILTSSGNAIYMRDAILKLAADTGNLGAVFKASGSNLENMNELMAQQSERVQATAETMNISREQAMKYYIELGKVPGIFGASVSASGEMIRGMGKAVDANGAKIDMFTATLAAAKGMGRDLSSVTTDLTKAFYDYGISGEAALNFSERMSDISSNLGIDLSSVQSNLMGTADAFKEFAKGADAGAKLTQGLATVTNEYSQALQAQGLSGNVALEVASNMVKTFGAMGVAQKAFLSAQSGGPGGLMGAFQIDKDLQEGNIVEVFQKVREQMKRQMGDIVTLDDASKSPAAAAQLARQMAIVQKGPLGQFAKTDQEAYRVLDALKAGDAKIKALAPEALKGSMDKGIILQDQTRTIMSGIRSLTERQVALTEMTNLILVQNLTAAGGTRRGPDTDWQSKMRDAMVAQRSMAATRGETVNEAGAQAIKGGAINFDTNTVNQGMAQTTGQFVGLIQKGRDAMVNAAQEATHKMMQTFQDKIAATMDPVKKAQIEKERDSYASQHSGDLNVDMMSPGGQLTGAINSGVQFSSGAQVGAAAKNAASGAGPLNTAAVNKNTIATNMPQQAELAYPAGKLGNIDVHVTGYCIKCKQEIEGGSQVSAISPSARNT